MEAPVPTKRRYTVEEYLRLEDESIEKHEYRDGEIFAVGEAIAMAGGSLNHSLLIANVIRELGNRLKGSPCRLFESNLRVRVPRKTLYAYPDLSIVCGRPIVDPDKSLGETVTNPRTIIEVLSPGTERYDRGDKFSLYRDLESLQEYVLVSQTGPRIETFFRQGDGAWLFTPYEGEAAVVKLQSVDVDLPLADVYVGVEFAQPRD